MDGSRGRWVEGGAGLPNGGAVAEAVGATTTTTTTNNGGHERGLEDALSCR